MASVCREARLHSTRARSPVPACGTLAKARDRHVGQHARVPRAEAGEASEPLVLPPLRPRVRRAGDVERGVGVVRRVLGQLARGARSICSPIELGGDSAASALARELRSADLERGILRVR